MKQTPAKCNKMNLTQTLENSSLWRISSIDMHTTGEPTRIVYAGFPSLHGKLLEQRAQAKRDYDDIRKRLILEPRGHRDMYGAVLRQDTELIRSGEAHIGVLFMTNDGFSTMCGHASIALGRFLIDTYDLSVFPRREELKFDPETRTTAINLHTPCGIVKIKCPTTADGKKSDPMRPVSFISVPSFATGVNVRIPLPETHRWDELHSKGARRSVQVDFSYGGAFYCIINATEMGFYDGLKNVNTERLNHATRLLKDAINNDEELRALCHHPDHNDLSFLYSIMVVDDKLGTTTTESASAETGLCFFADQQVDRSPTGGGVAARVALAYAKGIRKKDVSWTYHSLVSNAFDGRGAMVGTVIEEVEIPAGEGIAKQGVRVKVEGQAYYTGMHTFIVEEGDLIGEQGFAFDKLGTELGDRIPLVDLEAKWRG
jgi:trans-L-3-hydroxyproline dehydratase